MVLRNCLTDCPTRPRGWCALAPDGTKRLQFLSSDGPERPDSDPTRVFSGLFSGFFEFLRTRLGPERDPRNTREDPRACMTREKTRLGPESFLAFLPDDLHERLDLHLPIPATDDCIDKSCRQTSISTAALLNFLSTSLLTILLRGHDIPCCLSSPFPDFRIPSPWGI